MKTMRILMLFLVSITFLSFNQDEKVKVRFKKGNVLVNKVPWSTYKDVGNKSFVKTLSGVEYVTVTNLKYGTDKYDQNGKEIFHYYSELNFLNTDIEPFEVDLYIRECFIEMYNLNVLKDDVFDLEKAKEFKKRYEDKVSERHFKTK